MLDEETTADPVEGATETEAERKYRFGDEEVPHGEVERVWKEYRNDTSWRARNTQEAQRNAERGRQLDAWDTWVKSNPDKYAELQKVIEGQKQAGAPVDTSFVDKAKEEVGVMVEELKIEREIGALKSQYPDFFKDDAKLPKEQKFETQMIQFCLDNNIRDFGVALKALTYDRQLEAKAKATREAEAKANSRGLAGPKGSKGGDAGKGKLKIGSPEWKRSIVENDAIWGDEK